MTLVPTCGATSSNPLASFDPTQILESLICTFGSSMTVAGFLLFCWFVVSTMSYIRNQSIAQPLVLLLLIGGATVPALPSVGSQVAAIALLGGIASLSLLVARRVDRI